jgi:uncharacterized protein YkwD
MTSQFVRIQVVSLVLAWLTVIIGFARAHAESVPTDIARLERQVHELVNAYRVSKGLEPLDYSEQVALVARSHSRDMAREIVGMGHEGAEGRGTTLAKFITYTQFAENVGVNNAPITSTARAVVRGWLNSPGHRANIERDVDLTGIGIVRSGEMYFFTQLFLSTRSSPSSRRATRRSRDFAPPQDSSASENDAPRLHDDSRETQ